MVKRPLWMVAVLMLGAAGTLWGATRVGWGSDHELGASLNAIALLALAGLVGMFAVGGWARRILGAIVVVAGGFVGWLASAAAGPWHLFSGRGLALLSCVLLVAAGLLIVRHASRLPTMGAKYQLADTQRRSGDPHRDMWDDLSQGEDPTRERP